MNDDTKLLDWLQAKTDEARYSGRVLCRLSVQGRGWRLHETNAVEEDFGAEPVSDVRQAIREAMGRELHTGGRF